MSVVTFINELKNYNLEGPSFNPWRDFNDQYDIGPTAAEIRSEQLQRYLESRITKARYILIGEALGYQGGRFSGIPMTSERIITGNHPDIDYTHVFNGEIGKRTSNHQCNEFKKTQCQKGLSEQTASIVWKAILDHNVDAYEIALWNIFPFHPYDESKGFLSNRTPSSSELECGIYFLEKLLSIFPDNSQLICVGQQSKNMLDRYGVRSIHIPHPANGGAPKFREGFNRFIF